MNRFLKLSYLDRLRVLEGQVAETSAMTRILERRLDDPYISEEEVLGISSDLANVEQDMIRCLHDILLIEQEVGQIPR